MSEVVAIVEGPTEQTFVRDHLAAHLGALGITIWPVLSGKSRRHGGVRKWESAQGDILRTLKEGRYVTTMFDFYGMPNDWPGRAEATQLPFDKKGEHVEANITQAIAVVMGGDFDPRQFIPYVQVHEFEALLFSDVNILAETLSPISAPNPIPLHTQFQGILDQAGPPEAINDNYDTCPSRRIAGLVPGYRKPLHGPIVAERIGLDAIRGKCNHFDRWLKRMEHLAVRRDSR